MTHEPSLRKVLLIAFHFPPIQGSSGIQRTLGLARHLPSFSWRPIVLTANATAYPAVEDRQLTLIPDGVIIHRAMCFDTKRHFSVAGRYPDFLAVPDRWVSWIPFGIASGLKVIRRYKPDMIWSTYPIASAHVIAHRLAMWTGIPWVADFRDPMVEINPRTGDVVPDELPLRRARLKIEQSCTQDAASLVFCTNGARDICLERYPALDPRICHVIANGFEDDIFREVGPGHIRDGKANDGTVTILHSGTIYLTPDRDPSQFFQAVAELQNEGFFDSHPMRFILRAAGNNQQINELLERTGVAGRIKLADPLPYRDALTEMLSVDGLLLLQGYTSNPAIPAKLYEYLRARKPVLALVDAQGSTASLLRSLNTSVMASIESKEHIKHAVRAIHAAITSGTYSFPTEDQVQQFSRRVLAGETAKLFDRITDQRQ